MTTQPPNTAPIRQALNRAFDDPGLAAFCFDYFPKVYDSFSQGMRKDEKIGLLLEYCRRLPTGFERLLEGVRQQYALQAKSDKSSRLEDHEFKPLIDALVAYTASSPRIEEGSSSAGSTLEGAGSGQPKGANGSPLRAARKPAALPTSNPFYYTRPTLPDEFMGRWALVEEMVADLSKPRPDSWAVIGGRRFGKSSLLKAIQSRLTAPLLNAVPGERHFLPLIVDLKRCATETEESIYACILRELYRVLRRHQGLAIDLPASALHSVRNHKSLSFYEFEDTLEALGEQFESAGSPLRLVLLLDEVEFIIPFAWSETLFNNLRALIYDGRLADTVCLVLTGSAKVIQARQSGSPLLNALKIRHLALFLAADLKELIARGGQMPSQAAAAVQAESGGHPFIAQYLLHHLWVKESGLSEATPALVEERAHEMRRERNQDFYGWWQAVGESGQRTYRLLAKKAGWLEDGTLRKRSSGQEFELGLAALCYHGLVACDKSLTQRYRVAGLLFQGWFLRNVVAEEAGSSKTPPNPGVPSGPREELPSVATIENPKGFQLPAKADLILREMFEDYQRLVITKDFSALGFSGSWIYRVEPLREGKSPDVPVVVKIASVSLIEKECQAYEQCIKNQWLEIAQLRSDPVIVDELAGLCYSLAGGGVFSLKSLREYCLDAEVKVHDILFVLQERLFHVMKERILLPSRKKFNIPLQASYDAMLPVNLLIEGPSTSTSSEPRLITPQSLPLLASEPLLPTAPVRVEGFIITKVDLHKKTVTLNLPTKENAYRLRLKSVENLAHVGVGEPMPPFSGVVKETRQSRFEHELAKLGVEPTALSVTLPDGSQLPNPLAAIADLLSQYRNLKTACIHGDLNLENVLVDPNVRVVRLIDFAEAREDHVLHDFLRLETEVITKLLPVAFSQANLPPQAIYPFYEQLHAARFQSTDETPQVPHQALEKPFAILSAIRQSARDGLYNRDDFSEYYQCLSLYLVGALRFSNLERDPLAPLPKQLAFWGSAAILKLLNSLPDVKASPQPLPKVPKVPKEEPSPPPAEQPQAYRRLLIAALALVGALLLTLYLLAPQIAVRYNNQGTKDYQADDLPSAQANYQWALRWDSNNAQAHYNLGAVYEEQIGLYGKEVALEKASTEYRLAITGGLDAAYNNLARLQIRAGNHEEAVQLLQQGLEHAQDNHVRYDMHKNLGWALLSLPNYPEAESNLQAAIHLNNDRAPAHCLLAQVREGQNKVNEALLAWENCLKYADSRNPEELEWIKMARERLLSEGDE